MNALSWNRFKQIINRPVYEHIRRVEVSDSLFIFITVLLFYFSLWFLNPSNNFVVVFFVGIFFVLNTRVKNFRLALALTYISSLIITTGKTYSIELIPPYVLPIENWELGFIVFLVVAVRHFISFCMLFVIVRDVMLKTRASPKISPVDILFYVSFLWITVSDVFVSKQPMVSLAFTALSLNIPIFYLFARTYLKSWKNFTNILLSILCAVVVFEAFVSLQQFSIGGPAGKTIEQTSVGADFGQAIDEVAFGFRSFGTFDHANELGTVLAFLLPVFFALFYTSRSYFNGLIFIICLLTLMLTLSRSAWMAAGMSIVFCLHILKTRWHLTFPRLSLTVKLIAFIAFMMIFIVVALPRLEKSVNIFYPGGGINVRVLQAEKRMTLLLLHPLFGVGTYMDVPETVGLNPAGAMDSWPAPIHNGYLLMAVENGVPALLLLLIFVLLYFRSFLHTLRDGDLKQNDVIIIGFLGGIVSLLTNALAQPVINRGLIVLAMVAILSSRRHSR